MFSYIVLLAVFMLFSAELDAQCAMCKASLESNLNGEESVGGGINDGILYIMSLPYILFVTVGFLLYKHYKKTQ